MLPYRHAKNLRYRLIPSRHVHHQRMLVSDLTRSILGCTRPKMSVSRHYLLERHNWTGRITCWEHLNYRFFADMRLFQNRKEHCYAPILRLKKKRTSTNEIFGKRSYFGENLGFFPESKNFSEKFFFLSFRLSRLCKFRKSSFTIVIRYVFVLTLPVPCISESCIEIKTIKLIFFTSLWCLKRFYEGLKGPFDASQRSVKIKI